MDASAFWKVIGQYNQSTRYIQAVLLAVLVLAVFAGFRYGKANIIKYALGILNLFIAFGFFFAFGTQAIQRYFAFPLFLSAGTLFIYEAIRYGDDIPEKPRAVHYVFFALYLLYPLVSLALGNSFPEMVTHIMPCPVATVSLALYSLCRKKNRALLILLTIWGLTGIKSVIFAAYEDIILLAAGIFGVVLVARAFRKKTEN